jgi:hypothetical protein
MKTRFDILKLVFQQISLVFERCYFILSGYSPSGKACSRPAVSEAAAPASAVKTAPPQRLSSRAI